MIKRLTMIAIAALLGNAASNTGPVLGSVQQIERERLALAVLARPDMQSEIRKVAALYAADAQGRTAAGAHMIGRASHSITMATIYYAISELGGPTFLWCCNAPHRRAGLVVPRAGYGIDNPDNVYRIVTLDGAGRYVIRGRMPPAPPAEIHFELRDSVPGTGKVVMEGGALLAGLRSDRMIRAADGSFTVALDAAPANGRINHIRLPRQPGLHLIVRDLFTDWSTQSPVPLEILRLDDAPAKAEPDASAVAKRAIAILDKIAAFWLDFDNRLIYAQPANTIAAPVVRGVGRGMATSGHFSLKPDEALVVTVDRLSAGSLGVQLTDPWGVAYDYVRRTSSLNNVQASPNHDGTYSFVIAARDPHVRNWLDPQGEAGGMVAVRWQDLAEGANPALAIRDVRLVTMAALRAALPPETVFLSPRERAAQRTQRGLDFARRLTSGSAPVATRP